MNNITSWMQQAKDVTKKISDLMHIPPEDNAEPEKILDNTVSEEVYTGTKTKENAISLKEERKKGNTSSTMEFERSIGNRSVERSETNSASTVEAARKYASKVQIKYASTNKHGSRFVFICNHLI